MLIFWFTKCYIDCLRGCGFYCIVKHWALSCEITCYFRIPWNRADQFLQQLKLQETTNVYTQEYPITLSLFGIGQMSRLNASCSPITAQLYTEAFTLCSNVSLLTHYCSQYMYYRCETSEELWAYNGDQLTKATLLEINSQQCYSCMYWISP